MRKRQNARVLILSDQHFPYAHPDIFKFLEAIKKHYRPDRVVNIGDEIDGHSISMHEGKDPDLLSPGKELELAIQRIQRLQKIFPDMDLVESNHGSLVYRRAKFFGIPLRAIRTYADVLDVDPKRWRWHRDLTLKMSNGEYVYFCHGKSGNPLKLSKSVSMSSVQGHFHSKFSINYWANSRGLYFDLVVGCLIDPKSEAFAYGANSVDRPIIGTAIILDGYPRLLPMVLDGRGRWIGRLV